MLTFSLQSGSNGNCIYVEAGDVRLVFDAGISGEQAANRMKANGRDIRQCQALIISHNHWDHASGAGIFQRKFGLPVYMTEPVYRAVRPRIGTLRDVRRYMPGDCLEFGDVKVYTVPTPHDGIDTVCFVIEHDGKRLGILTDLGRRFTALEEILSGVDGAYLESNYDTDMLMNGSYPLALKKRITGGEGHLSNDEAAVMAHECASARLKWLAVAHLSQHNNRPDLAIECQHRRIGQHVPVHLASRYAPGPVLEV